MNVEEEFFKKAAGMPSATPSHMLPPMPAKSMSWFSIGLNFGFGFFLAGALFSILAAFAWVVFLGALFMGAHR